MFHQYTVRVPMRDAVQKQLTARGVASMVYYPVPMHLQPLFGPLGYKRGDLPECERAADEVLSLPIYAELTDDQIEHVVNVLGDAVSRLAAPESFLMTDLRDPQGRRLISLVIPVFNEEDGIDQLRERLGLVRAMWRETADVEFVFVDDGSSDNTRHALHRVFGTDALSQIAVHEVNRGIGAAMRTGFARSRGSIVCTIDADCSYGPENLQRLTVALDEQDADIAVASPYHPQGIVEGVPHWRLVLSKSCSAFYRVVAPVRLHTYTSVFRAYRRDVVEAVVVPGRRIRISHGNADTGGRARLSHHRSSDDPARPQNRANQDENTTNNSWTLRLIGTTAVRRIHSALKTRPRWQRGTARTEPSMAHKSLTSIGRTHLYLQNIYNSGALTW